MSYLYFGKITILVIANKHKYLYTENEVDNNCRQ